MNKYLIILLIFVIEFVHLIGHRPLIKGYWEAYKPEINRRIDYLKLAVDVRRRTDAYTLERDFKAYFRKTFPTGVIEGDQSESINTGIGADKIIYMRQYSNTLPSYDAVNIQWAKYVYGVGNYLFSIGLEKQAEIYFDLSVKLAPFWSHFMVELANYYMVVGNREKAIMVVNQCLSISITREHCLVYFANDGERRRVYDVGFLSEVINEEVK